MKKTLALLLALAMLLGLLAGCGSGKETAATEPDPAADAAAAAEEAEEDYLPLVRDGEEKTITIGVCQNINVVDYDTNEFTLWVEEKTGINLEFVCFSSNASEARQQVTLMIAGGEELPDILYDFYGLSANAVQEFGQDGYFVDMAPYFGTYDHYLAERIAAIPLKSDRDRIINNGKDPDTGAIYGFPNYTRTKGLEVVANQVLINTRWMEAVGEEMPKTTEDFKRILIKFRDMDPNGNGKADEIPSIGSTKMSRTNLLEWILNAFIYLNDNYLYNIDENGRIWAPHVTDEYRQGLIYLNDLYKEGLISPMIFSIASSAQMKEMITPSDGSEIVGIAACGHVMSAHNANAEQIFDYKILPVIDANTGKGGFRASDDAKFAYPSFITEDCDDPVLAFRLLDFLCSDEAFKFIRYGKEGRDWVPAEEGMLDQWGEPANIWVLDPSVNTTQNNTNWHDVVGIYYSGFYNNYAFGEEEAVSYQERVQQWYGQCLEDMIQPPENPNLLFSMIWPAAKVAERTEYSSQVWSYVEQARALFVTGELDPNSDADWQSYLNELETMGFYKLMELYQENYDRFYANAD